jgi:hypothetical protein
MNTQHSATDSQELRDLLARLTGHSWLAFTYVVGMILVIYVFGLYNSPGLLYAGIELPTFLAVYYVLSSNALFRPHVAFLWPVTALMVWSYLSADLLGKGRFGGELFPLCVLFIFSYWIFRATAHSKDDFVKNRRTSSLPFAIASVLTVWGAFLQVAFVALLPLRFLVEKEIAESLTGSWLVTFLEVIRLSSPVAWFPIGLIVLGISLFVIIGLKEDPYVARDYDDVLSIEAVPSVDLLLAGVRLPLWIAVVIIEFVKHILMLAGRHLRVFFGGWFGRLGLILFGLVLPLVAMVLGHFLIYRAMELVAPITGDGTGYVHVARRFFEAVLVHVAVLIALTSFVVSVAPIAIRVESPNIATIKDHIQRYLRSKGFEAAQAVGKAFVLYGLVILAVPVAALIPKGAGWGVFSTLYASLLFFLGVSYILWDRLPEEQRREQQRKLSEFLGNLGVTRSGGKIKDAPEEATHVNN